MPVHNGLLTYVQKEPAGDAQLHLTLTKPRLLALFGGDTTSTGVDIVGDIGVVRQLQSVLDPGDKSFNIVTP